MTEIEPDLVPYRDSPLLAGLEEDLARFAELWRARLFSVTKGESIDRQLARKCPGELACILSGGALLRKYDVEGNQAVLDFARPGYLLGAFGVLCDMPFHGLCVMAAAPGVLLTFRPSPVDDGEFACHDLQNRLHTNMLGLLTQQSWQLMKKTEILSQRSLREKVLAFLSAQREYFHSDTFELAMDRQTMADYLYINRSSLSRELGWLREEGLIDYHRSKFALNFPPVNL